MDVTIKHQPAFALAVVKLAGNEEIKVEPGAMVSHSDGLTTETKASGGLFGGLNRMVAGESVPPSLRAIVREPTGSPEARKASTRWRKTSRGRSVKPWGTRKGDRVSKLKLL